MVSYPLIYSAESICLQWPWKRKAFVQSRDGIREPSIMNVFIECNLEISINQINVSCKLMRAHLLTPVFSSASSNAEAAVAIAVVSRAQKCMVDDVAKGGG